MAECTIINTGRGGTSPVSGRVHCHRQCTIINARYHRPYVTVVLTGTDIFFNKSCIGKNGLKQVPVI